MNNPIQTKLHLIRLVENHSIFIKSSRRKEEQRGEEVSELMSPKPTSFPVVLALLMQSLQAKFSQACTQKLKCWFSFIKVSALLQLIKLF